MQYVFPHLSLAHFRFTLKALDTIWLPPYKGSTIRGGFGITLKNLVCMFKGEKCSECVIKEQCMYQLLFEGLSAETIQKKAFLRKTASVPQPFILRPPLTEQQKYLPGEKFEFEIILMGKASEYLAIFVAVFMKFGETGIGKQKGKFSLSTVHSLHPDGNMTIAYDSLDDEKRISSYQTFNIQDILSVDKFDYNSQKNFLKIHFHTCLRLKVKRKLVSSDKFEFSVLFKSLMRRISTLFIAYGNINDLDIPFQVLEQKAKTVKTIDNQLTWMDWKRYSTRKHETTKMGGLVGSVVFAGDFTDLLPFLYLGQYLHAGKNITFGLGWYSMFVPNLID